MANGRLNSATTTRHLATMSYWAATAFRRILVCLLAMSIVIGASSASYAAHTIAPDGMVTCQTTDKSYSPELKTPVVKIATDWKATIDGQFENSKQDSQIALDVGCCATICGASAMLVGAIVPAERDTRQVGSIVSPAQLLPADYDPIRRPPRTTSEID